MLPTLLLLITLAAGAAAGLLRGDEPKPRVVRPIVTIVVALTVASGFVAQLLFPAVLEFFARDPSILRGEVWRGSRCVHQHAETRSLGERLACQRENLS